MRNSSNLNTSNGTPGGVDGHKKNAHATGNNNKHVTTTTVTDHNKVPRVEKVVFDNRIKRKNVLALNEKVAAIREYEKRPVYKRIGRMFHCSPDQIKRIVQQKDVILKAWEQRTRKSRDAKTLEMKVVRVSMLGKAVYEWIRRMMYYKDFQITDGLIQKMALQFRSAMGLQNFFPHQEWCDKFRSTYKIFTSESKELNIAYTQGHSVQIKDVMKDVLSECCPDDGDDDDDDVENINSGNNDDGDCVSLDSDEGQIMKGQENAKDMSNIRKSSKVKTKSSLQSKTSLSKSKSKALPASMQGIHQLVALPIQGNGLGQKVLVATPIVAPGQNQGKGPMTMTIIPLATLGQPGNVLNAAPGMTQQSKSQQNGTDKSAVISIPPPIVEIKKEIKQEPLEEGTVVEAEEDDIKIKKEYITDEEDEADNDKPTLARPKVPKMPTLQPAHVVAIPIHNKQMLEETSRDSMDDLTLSSLKKRMKIEETSAVEHEKENGGSPQKNISPPADEIQLQTAPMMPPMPRLTKAPNLVRSPISSPPLPPPPVPAVKNGRKRASSGAHNPELPLLPSIRSCNEARSYLKLLEDFALERENFRLIGLITRADEVLRELDRKDCSEGENDEVDVD